MKITNKVQAAAVLAELEKRRQADVAGEKLFEKKPHPLTDAVRSQLIKLTHAAQQQVIFDPCTRIALKCPRRTGKSTALLFRAYMAAKIYPGSNIAYIVPSSRDHAKRLFWKPLAEMDTKLRLGYDFKIGENRVVTPEGTSIYLFGAKNKESPRVLRGDAWSLGILDECKDFGTHFEELIIEALMPGLEDYGGTLCLAGTPGSVLSGLFYNITAPDTAPEGWSVHKWDKSVNTFMSPEKRDLDYIEKHQYFPMGLNRFSPKFRREQLAEWCTDETERAYLYSCPRNTWVPDSHGNYTLPPGHDWLYVLGLDLGERDANAFIVFAFAMTHLDTFCVHEFARPRMSIDEIAAETRHLIEKFGNMVSMVADTGGYGRGIVTDLQERHNLPFEAADKSGNKLGNIAQMNSDFLIGKIKLKDDGVLAKELKQLTRKIRKTDGKVIIGHSDLGDAALYAWKASKHFAAQERDAEPTYGTDEYYIEQERAAVERAVRKRRADSGAWWGGALTDSAA